MRPWIMAAALVLAALVLAACAAQEEAKPAPAAPAAAPEAAPAWQEEWERGLAAAKREGRVAVIGPTGAERRQALTEPFEKRYGITVEYFGGRGADQMGRLTAERQAGQYLWDVFIGGSTTGIVVLKPMNALEPLKPLFILPEVKDPKSWRGGEYPFLDKDGLVFAMIGQTSDIIIVGTNFVKPQEFKSYKDLLAPKWKGKITVDDPRVTGSGQGAFQFFYLHPELGPDFIRALAKQDLHLSRDYETQLRWVAEGRYPVCISCSQPLAEPKIAAGVPLARVHPKQFKEGGFIGTGMGALSLFNRAPHPNAAKVYINWVLSKEGSAVFTSAGGYISRRADVPPAPEVEWMIPAPTDIPSDTEEARLQREKLVPFFQEVFGR